MTWVCTYKGFHVGHGAEGVARATTQAVVLVLGADPRLGLLPRIDSALNGAMIKVEGLRKSFRGQPVLRGIDLEVPDRLDHDHHRAQRRRQVGLPQAPARPAAARQPAGSMVDGVDITRLRGRALDEVRKRYGVVFQGGALFDSMTCRDNVAFPLREKSGCRAARIRQARGRRAGPGGAGRHRRQVPGGGLGRHAQAGGDRPGAGHRARDRLLRRADDRPRPRPGQHDPPADPRAAPPLASSRR